jgi:predicted nucleotidyltransferase
VPTADQASADIAAVTELGVAGPPQGWSARARDRLGWSGLGAVEREVLRHAWWIVTSILPDAELWLFGSRATGEAQPDSDYDLAVIYPDVTPEGLVDLAMGELWTLGRQRGVELDRQRITASSAFA